MRSRCTGRCSLLFILRNNAVHSLKKLRVALAKLVGEQHHALTSVRAQEPFQAENFAAAHLAARFMGVNNQ